MRDLQDWEQPQEMRATSDEDAEIQEGARDCSTSAMHPEADDGVIDVVWREYRDWVPVGSTVYPAERV
jgi:hypothetical protein